MTRDWVAWHRDYEDPLSQLSQRLVVVANMIRSFLDTVPPGPIRVLSLCAGDARDITTASADHPRKHDLSVVLVEFDANLVEMARTRIATAGINGEIRCADAGNTNVFADVLPVDLLLLVGIFGNIPDADIEQTILAVPMLCTPMATVIWTRHRRPPDVTPKIREWFNKVGCTSIAFESTGSGKFAVGSERVSTKTNGTVPNSMFHFSNDLW
jgi:hypothetical protein